MVIKHVTFVRQGIARSQLVEESCELHSSVWAVQYSGPVQFSVSLVLRLECRATPVFTDCRPAVRSLRSSVIKAG